MVDDYREALEAAHGDTRAAWLAAQQLGATVAEIAERAGLSEHAITKGLRKARNEA
jgi:DNA-directed RNA polymerase specialized sigma24 family protein